MRRVGVLCAMRLYSILFAACAVGCGAAKPVPPPPPPTQQVVRPDARAAFERALSAFVAHERAGDWTPARCRDVAAMFDAAASAQGGAFASASFDAGLAHQRCGDDASARTRFESAMRADPELFAAKAKVALLQYKADRDVDKAIATLEHVVVAGKFQDPAALVDLATLQATRDGARGSASCADDRTCARLNLQRALAIDDAFMPALNQLALLHLKLARHEARGAAHVRRVTNGTTRVSAHVQELELAALVCSQATRKNPTYAPIHNTTGLVMVELGRTNAAIESFAKATRLDARFFEAHMNLAALNLSFRGYGHAERAYREALALRPDDYDAHLGLAVALRGPLTGAEPDLGARVAVVRSLLDGAQKLDAQRPEAYFNRGVLEHEFGAVVGAPKPELLAAYRRAETALEAFLGKAAGRPEYADASARARERLEDIQASRAFVSSP